MLCDKEQPQEAVTDTANKLDKISKKPTLYTTKQLNKLTKDEVMVHILALLPNVAYKYQLAYIADCIQRNVKGHTK
jgi:hypothetical protein